MTKQATIVVTGSFMVNEIATLNVSVIPTQLMIADNYIT